MPQPVGVPPERSHRSPAGPVRPDGLPPGLRLRRAVSLLLLSLAAPGTAQVLAGNRRIGRLVRRTWLGLLFGLSLLAVAWLVARTLALRVLTSPAVLIVVAVVSCFWAVVMAAVVVDAWRLGRPDLMPIRARRWLAGTTVLLVLVAGYPLLAIGGRAFAAADLIGSVFTGAHPSAASGGRFNVLLLGGDAGPDRVGTRPDSVTLASIDAGSGRTVLFSLPRNLENVPFASGSPAARAWPRGYSCGDACLLNAVYTWAAEHPDLFPGVADPGAEAMKEAAEGITGLEVNYYVLIDLAGFEQLIDALGGITVHVTAPVPIGGGTSKVSGYVAAGTQRLDGYHALWFARSRQGASDYARMARQRCVMDAMLRQLDPQAVVVNFQQVAAAGKGTVSTDIPAGQLPTFLDLAVKARSQPVRSVQFVPPLITPARPDFGVIRSLVTQAVSASQHTARPTTPTASAAAAANRTSPAGRGATTPSARPSATATTGPAGDDVASVCSPA
jgi:LCP family protein required for cell wall assembly